MGDEETTRSCGTCHKDVAEANFSLHETHCRRFLCLCPDCREHVPREQLEQHREEQHTQVRCSECHLQMERCHLVDHQADLCERRLLLCEFCQLQLPLRQLQLHRPACGSRTERCGGCSRYVTLRDRPGHGHTCPATGGSETGGSATGDSATGGWATGGSATGDSATGGSATGDSATGDSATGGSAPQTAGKLPRNKTRSTALCGCCLASFPAADVEQHELQCLLASRLNYEEEEEEDEEDEEEAPPSGQRATPWLSRGFRGPRPRGGGGAGDPDRISSCPHCHLALPLATLRWHQVKCHIVINLR